MYSTAWLRNY